MILLLPAGCFRPAAVALVSLVLWTAGCTASSPDTSATRQPAVVQPGAPGQTGKVLSADQVPRSEGGQHTEADVRFMQGMIEHHAQALRMTALVAGRSTSRDLALVAKRIEISQQDEIRLMQRWLRARNETVPSVGKAGRGHHGGGAPMPGMLTEEQFAELERARGTEFDRLFYTFMIYHHTGALRMVEQLFADKGGEEPEVYRFASHIDSDQRIEIDRMRRLLAELGGA